MASDVQTAALSTAFIALEQDPVTSKLVFQLPPSEVQAPKSAVYEEIDILGRSEPYSSYRSSTATIYSFTLNWIDSMGTEDDPPGMTPEQGMIRMQAALKFLQSLVFPQYQSAQTKAPPMVFFVVGMFIAARCAVVSATPTVPRESAWNFLPLHPRHVSVALQLKEINTYAPDHLAMRTKSWSTYGFSA